MSVRKKELEEKVKAVRDRTDVPLTLGWAYGKPRLYIENGHGVIELSPRLPKPELWDWLNAWEAGFLAGVKVSTTDNS